MKKILIVFIALFVFAAVIPVSVDAQSCKRKSYRRSNANYAVRGYRTERRPSIYRRHRNLINIGIGTGAGALVGGLLGGKRGAAWGALAGAGAGTVYTYKIKPKRRTYRRY